MSRKKNTLFVIAFLLFAQIYVFDIPLTHIILTGVFWWSPLVLLLFCGFGIPTSEKVNPKSFVLTILCWEKNFGRKMIPPQYLVMDTVLSYQRSGLVICGTELGIFDVTITENGLSVSLFVSALQQLIGPDKKCDAALVFRLLRSLSSIGFFELVNGGPRSNPMDWIVKHTKESALLASSHPSTLRPYALAHGRMNVEPWNLLKNYFARPANAEPPSADNCPFAAVNNLPFYSFLRANPTTEQLLQEKMESIGEAVNNALVQEIQWSTMLKGCSTLVDIGGGRGLFLNKLIHSLTDETVQVLREVTLFDNEMISDETTTIRNIPYNRVVGSFFEDSAIPQNADVYLIKFVINDWDDAAALKILQNVAKAMKFQSSRLFLAEQIIPSTESPFRSITDRSALTDLDFFVLNGGKVRSEFEQETMLNKAGLKLVKTHWTTGICHVLEVTKSN